MHNYTHGNCNNRASDGCMNYSVERFLPIIVHIIMKHKSRNQTRHKANSRQANPSDTERDE
nr:MAG TPA: hypothetical protein [Caudoviricetes sp.]